MEPLYVQDIAHAVGARYDGGNLAVTAVSTDSRDISAGCLFIALEGESFDGHDYIAQSLQKGAACAVAMRAGNYGTHDRVLYVADTRQALLDVGRLHRDRMGARVVGVTGSVGKTTTRDMTACVLSAAYSALCTRDNLNNEVGLPKTLLELTPEHKAAVLEMGMDGPGQIRRMAKCARPDVGIITNIGVTHIERLGSRENIFATKMELTEGMPDGAVLILCGDDDLLNTVKTDRLRIVRYGVRNVEAEIRAEEIRGNSAGVGFVIVYNGQRFPAHIPAMGEHNVLAALAGFAAGVALGIEPHRAAGALQNFSPTGMRQKMVNCRGFTVVEDCYNASPDSMRAALKTLAAMPCEGRKIAVLSDMLELGEDSPAMHREVGRFAARCGIDDLFCTGTLAEEIALGARFEGMRNVRWVAGKADLARELRETVRQGDAVWLKASRGMRLEDILEQLYTKHTENV